MLSTAPLCLLAVPRVGDACASYGNRSVYSAVWCMPFGEPMSVGLVCPPRTCWYLLPACLVSAALARRSRCSLAGQWGRGLFSISRARCHPCAPVAPAPSASVHLCVRLLSGFFAACPFLPSPTVGSGVCALGVRAPNRSSIEGKCGRLVAYIVLHDPEFVYLQELWVDLDPPRLVGLPYRLFSGDIFRGGGVAVLVHPRRAGRAKVQVWRERHALGVCVRPETPEAVAVVSAHLPPKMDPDERACLSKRSSGFSSALGPFSSSSRAVSMRLQGGFNAAPRRARGSKALAPGRPWASLVCPYPPGSPTIIVPLRSGHVSYNVADWLLVHKNTPVTACRCEVLPGLSTHLAMPVHIGVGSELLRPQDPIVCQFLFPLERDLASPPPRARSCRTGRTWASGIRMLPCTCAGMR